MTLRYPAIAVLLLVAGTAFGAELGRMFFTPVQRATLDTARKQNIRVEFSDETTAEQPAAAPAPQNISVNGVIRRSDGKSTIWINNRPVTDESTGGWKVSAPKSDGRVRLTVPESGRSVDLKVGQTVETVSGTVEENYSRRAATKSEANAPLAGEGAATSEKSAPAAAPPAPASDDARKKRAARNKELDTLYDLQRPNEAPSPNPAQSPGEAQSQ